MVVALSGGRCLRRLPGPAAVRPRHNSDICAPTCRAMWSGSLARRPHRRACRSAAPGRFGAGHCRGVCACWQQDAGRARTDPYHDRLVFAFVDCVLVAELPEVDRVLEQVEQCAATEGCAADFVAVTRGPALRADALLFEIPLQRMDRAQLEIAGKICRTTSASGSFTLSMRDPILGRS